MDVGPFEISAQITQSKGKVPATFTKRNIGREPGALHKYAVYIQSGGRTLKPEVKIAEESVANKRRQS